MKSRFNKIDTTNIPFVWCFAFLKSYVSTGFEFSLKPTDARFVGIPEFFIDGIKDLFDMINLLFFKVVNFLQLFYFQSLLSDIIYLQEEIG